ncbi:hypothetical protein ACFQ0B_16165 [Nonomuraea thailandensis]
MTATLARGARSRADATGRSLSGHRVFGGVLVLAAALRVLVMLGYDTARLYWYDSFTYLDVAVHLRPQGAFHPAGYSWFLWALRPFHSVELVAGIQHAMGLGVAVMLYTLLRRWSVPGWAATAATVPVLFDPSFVRLEHSVLSDLQVIFLITAALPALLWRPTGHLSTRAATAAGLLLALAGLTRTAAVPLLGLAALFLLARRTPWRRIVAFVLAGGLPLLAYAGWYAQHHGRFALSGSDGVALWARTMTFADCSRIQPPPDLAPSARTAPSSTPPPSTSGRPAPPSTACPATGSPTTTWPDRSPSPRSPPSRSTTCARSSRTPRSPSPGSPSPTPGGSVPTRPSRAAPGRCPSSTPSSARSATSTTPTFAA